MMRNSSISKFLVSTVLVNGSAPIYLVYQMGLCLKHYNNVGHISFPVWLQTATGVCENQRWIGYVTVHHPVTVAAANAMVTCEIKLFQMDIDDGWNNFIPHVTMALAAATVNGWCTVTYPIHRWFSQTPVAVCSQTGNEWYMANIVIMLDKRSHLIDEVDRSRAIHQNGADQKLGDGTVSHYA